jgi:hypothetical protein
MLKPNPLSPADSGSPACFSLIDSQDNPVLP